MPSLRTCSTCGRPFAPAIAGHRQCGRCFRPGRAARSPSTRAQDAEYQRNRRLILEGSPRCALRIHCDGAPATTADHIKPVSRGGTNRRSNLQPACAKCNGAKGNRID